MKRKFHLTKSDYMLFLRCPRELWLKKNQPDVLKKEPTIEEKHLSEQGYLVQSYAQQLFTDKTSSGTLEFEKVFSKNGLYTRSDIVILDNPDNKLFVYEVKSSTSIKDEYIDDLAFQKYVMETLDFQPEKLFLIYVNNKYIRNGKVDPEQLLCIEDVTELVNSIGEKTKNNIKKAIEYIHGPQPGTSLAEFCQEKLECPYIKHFHTKIPEYNVFNISRIGKSKLVELLENNIVNIMDVPVDFELSSKQRDQVDIAQSKKKYIDKESIKKTLNELKYPLYFIDYETFNFAVPMFDGIRPYQQMVFQYSLHIQEKPGGSIQHREFLSTGVTEPSKDLVKQLRKDVKNLNGTFLVWNKSFEKTRNKEMAAMSPDYSLFLQTINNNIFDLMDIFSHGYYQHPEFKGKTSIKKILPVLVPELSYKELDINQGQLASIMWYRMTTNKTTKAEKQKIYSDLLKYCELDTWGMVKIFLELQKV